MIENQWKAKLIKLFKRSHPEGFTWSFEARFKSGFPDLIFIVSGRVVFMELKKVKKLPISGRFWKLFDPIQIEIMKMISKQNIDCYAVVGSDSWIEIGDPLSGLTSLVSIKKFEEFKWI